MFTLEQIDSAHAKVKTGADFPQYIRDIVTLGVARFETFVKDNHTDYYSESGLEAGSPGIVPELAVAIHTDAAEFRRRLKSHQAGETDFPRFRRECAETGISKWIVDLKNKTCIYYDAAGNEILVEHIPS